MHIRSSNFKEAVTDMAIRNGLNAVVPDGRIGNRRFPSGQRSDDCSATGNFSMYLEMMPTPMATLSSAYSRLFRALGVNSSIQAIMRMPTEDATSA